MKKKDPATDKEKDGLEEAQIIGVKIERQKRVPYQKFVSYGPTNPPMFNANATNISETGLSLHTSLKANNAYDTGTPLSLTINIGARNFKCEGVVSWTRTEGLDKEAHRRYCMGIKFTKVTKEFAEYCKDLIFSGYSCLDKRDTE